MATRRSKSRIHGSDNRVSLLGLDFGSTTSSAVVAKAGVQSNCVTGRMQFGNPQVVYRSESVFTPFCDDSIDEDQVARHLDEWLEQGGLRNEDIFASANILTGLAAQRDNAKAVVRLVEARIGETLIATADDPCLESWLAFMGSCSALSRHYPDTPIINLDIGGGTTNPAIGLNGNVLGTGCYFIGARHFQFVPGTYQLVSVSKYGAQLMEFLGIRTSVGDRLGKRELNAILDTYVKALEAIVAGEPNFFGSPVGRFHEQVPLDSSGDLLAKVITFSGGVGELIYKYSAGQPLPGTTYYGDLGIDLAVSVVESRLLSGHLDSFVPENGGRATVYGLTLHSTEVSGTTLFLPRPEALPLRDLPVVARLRIDVEVNEICKALSLARKSRQGACFQIVSGEDQPALAGVKTLGERLAQAFKSESCSPEQPLVILTSNNIGKTIGNYATNWGQLSVNLIVIDEIPARAAHFVNIGRSHKNIVPISFYGMY